MTIHPDFRVREGYGTWAPLEERLMRRVQYDLFGGCWLWDAGLSRGGYGQVKVHGRQKMAHRLAFELFVGPIPAGMEVRHKCDVTFCINPDHLEPGSHAQNMADMKRRGIASRDPNPPARHHGLRNLVMSAHASGEAIRSIARRLGVSPSAVRYHLKRSAA